jgi:hypothetical protein
MDWPANYPHPLLRDCPSLTTHKCDNVMPVYPFALDLLGHIVMTRPLTTPFAGETLMQTTSLHVTLLIATMELESARDRTAPRHAPTFSVAAGGGVHLGMEPLLAPSQGWNPDTRDICKV